jgi:hypothetical protein
MSIMSLLYENTNFQISNKAKVFNNITHVKKTQQQQNPQRSIVLSM